jgi:DNA-binding response OmpR family regulator
MLPAIRILYVEDDINLSFVTKDNLELAGFSVRHCTSGAEGWLAFGREPFDLCLLDVMLPPPDGFALATQIRQVNPQVPILFLSALADKDNRLRGLRLGADDYLTKPFSMEELLLKIEVFLRRSGKVGRGPVGQVLGLFRVDPANLLLLGPGPPQALTPREAAVLTYLLDRRGAVVRRDELLRAIWGDDDYFMGRSLDVFISRLRKYLLADPAVGIENLHGVGFRLVG